MAKNQLTIEIVTKSININETVKDIRQKLESIQTSYDKAMGGFKQNGNFAQGLKQLKDDIADGTKPAEELQSQFEKLQNSLIPTNEQIKEMQENLTKIKEEMALIEAKSPNNKKLPKLENAYNLESKEVASLIKTQAKYRTQLNDVQKEIKKFSDAEKENTKVIKDNGEKVKEQAANLYRLNAAMTIAKQTMKAIYGVLTQTSDAYARNALSVKAYDLTFGSLEDSAGSLTKELDNMVDTLEKFGYNRSDIQQMAVDFYSLATAVGVSKTAAVNMTSDYLKMANRISIATGETLNNVTQMLSTAITTGRASGVLTGLALDLRDESVKKLAVERGLIKAENEDLSQAEMYYLRQYALTEGILQNQNLLQNSGDKYLITQEQINSQISSLKENIGELIQGPLTFIMASFNTILKGINNVIAAINKVPVLKNIVSITGAIAVGMLSIFAAAILIKAGLTKVKTVLLELLPDTVFWQQSMWGVAKAAGAIIGVLSSVALIAGGIIGLQNKGIEDTTDKIKDQEDQTDETTKSVKKLKNELMGFDEINLLSKDNESTFNLENFEEQYKKLLEQLNNSAVNDLAKSFENASKWGNALSIAIGAITLALQGYKIVSMLVNKEKAKSNSLDTLSLALGGKTFTAKKKEQAQEIVSATTKKTEAAAQNKLNTAKAIGIGLTGLGIGLVVGALATGALFSAQQNSMTASANGNYFPSASATIIGEKYPEVAIPLGNSPQYADMQETIANRTAERLSELNNGFNGTVNVYIGNEQIRDFAVQAVNDDLRVNYGTNLGKLARS